MTSAGSLHYERQKRHWDAVERRRPPDHSAVRAFSQPKVDFVLENLGVEPCDLTLLEVGAGNGFLSGALEPLFRLTALDFSGNMLGRHPTAAARKVQADACRLPFTADAFDVVFCANLLHHLESPQLAVCEMARVARRHVVSIEPNTTNPLMALFGLMVPRERGTLRFTAGYLRDLGSRAKLRLRVLSTQGLVLPNMTPEPAVPLLQRLEVANPFCFYHVVIFDV